MPTPNLHVAAILLVSLGLLVAAAAMMRSHLRAWRAARQQLAEGEELHYRRRQFRRRMQTSAMLAVLAVALAAGHFLALWIHSTLFELVYWFATMLLACWFGLLAMVDLWATRRFFDRQRERDFLEQIKLRAITAQRRGDPPDKNLDANP